MLWHLKKESALSHLAREAVAWDRRSPHAWAIMGNCFSLQKVPTTVLSGHPHCLTLGKTQTQVAPPRPGPS